MGKLSNFVFALMHAILVSRGAAPTFLVFAQDVAVFTSPEDSTTTVFRELIDITIFLCNLNVSTIWSETLQAKMRQMLTSNVFQYSVPQKIHKIIFPRHY